MDAERAHHLVMAAIRFAGLLGLTKLARVRATGRGSVQAFGLHFDAPFGLAAGFDKNDSYCTRRQREAKTLSFDCRPGLD